MDFFKGLSLLRKLIIIGLALLVIFAGYTAVKRYFTSGVKTEAKLGKGQTGAAIATGHDAVETLGNRHAADAEGEKIVQETKDEIRKSADAAGVTSAGRRGLCRVAGNCSEPERVQSGPTK